MALARAFSLSLLGFLFSLKPTPTCPRLFLEFLWCYRGKFGKGGLRPPAHMVAFCMVLHMAMGGLLSRPKRLTETWAGRAFRWGNCPLLPQVRLASRPHLGVRAATSLSASARDNARKRARHAVRALASDRYCLAGGSPSSFCSGFLGEGASPPRLSRAPASDALLLRASPLPSVSKARSSRRLVTMS